MPVLKHAKKKLRQDKKRSARNKKLKDLFKKLVKEARAKKTAESLNKAFASIDKAAKNHILHKNKAARMKSSLSKLVEGKTSSSASASAKASADKKASEDKPVKKVEKSSSPTKKPKGTVKKKTSSSKK